MNQITKKERFSNFELLRLVAMFFVLMVHADFLSLDIPTQDDVLSTPMNAFVRFFIQSSTVVCVDVFVLISGWFGIRSSIKGFCKFAFQCLFFYVGIYVAMCLLGLESFSLRGIAGMFKFNWFIIAYTGLYILSSVLNAFVETVSKKAFRNVLICFFVLQTLYGWISNYADIFKDGYSIVSFIGLYLLARYAYVHKPNWTFSPPYRYLLIYFVLTILITSVSFISERFGVYTVCVKQFQYLSPLVIVSAFSLLLYFRSIKLKSRLVNWCAASSFAIFLLHIHPNIILTYFKPFVISIYNANDGVLCLARIFGFLLVIAITAILLDQIRKLMWKNLIDPKM